MPDGVALEPEPVAGLLLVAVGSLLTEIQLESAFLASVSWLKAR